MLIAIPRKDINKEKEAGNGPLKKFYFYFVVHISAVWGNSRDDYFFENFTH